MSTAEARRAANRRYYLRHREQEIERSKKWRSENLEWYQAWALKNKEKRRANGRKCEYNILPEEYDRKKAEQDGKCAICRQEVELLVVDHDHHCCSKRRTCGKCNRGLLCRSCNTFIGLAKESEEIFSRALEYLRKFRKPVEERASSASTEIRNTNSCNSRGSDQVSARSQDHARKH